MRLDQLTAKQCELVRQWRNAPDILPVLRTKAPLTVEEQAAFYRNVVCNPQSNHRYFALVATRLAHPLDESQHRADVFVGMGGLTYLDRVPGEGEISLILGPAFRRSGLGSMAVRALRAEAARMGLRRVTGECYDVNPARSFWIKAVARCEGGVRYEADRMFFWMRALA